jgi:hypothetical protein
MSKEKNTMKAENAEIAELVRALTDKVGELQGGSAIVLVGFENPSNPSERSISVGMRGKRKDLVIMCASAFETPDGREVLKFTTEGALLNHFASQSLAPKAKDAENEAAEPKE